MRQKSNGFVTVVVLIGFVACSFVANWLYDYKGALAPYERAAPTQFYAGLDKFLSNVSWMTLIQWQADDTQRMTPERADALYQKLNALTNLDPLFADAYLDGSLSLATYKPDSACALLDKAIAMGLDKRWKIPFYAGHIRTSYLHKPEEAERYFEMAGKDPDAPDFVRTARIHAMVLAKSGSTDGDTDPVAAMHVWYDHLNELKPDQAGERAMAANQVRAYGEDAMAALDSKLSGAGDPTTRESALEDRKWVAKVMDEMKAIAPVVPPPAGEQPPEAPTTKPAQTA